MKRFLSLLVALLLLVLTAHARADLPSPPTGKPSAADEASAKKQFETGLKLYGEGAFDGALIAFEASYRLGGRAVALKNVAQSHRAMKHFVDAYEAYEQLLERHDAQLGAPDKAAVKQALEELSILSGTLLVTVSEADATIEIDGKAIGKSPMAKPKRVSVAGHRVTVTKPGFEKHDESLNVGSQEAKKLDVKLDVEKNTGRVAVREQAGREVHVFVDGVDKGPAPFEGEIAAGEHTIEVKGPRFASEPRKITVVAKERADIAFDATALGGRLRVTTIPASANIAVDGKPMGTGAWEGDLPEGPHKIEVTLGDASQVREIVLTRGQLVVQEIAIASAVGARVEEYEGLYGKFSLQAGFALSGLASNDVPGTTTHDSAFLIMPTAVLRVGKSFGWLAAEVVGAVAFEHRDEKMEWVQPNGSATIRRKPQWSSNSLNGFIGVGPRVTSKNDTVRFTFALAPGVSIRTFSVETRRDDGNNGPDPNAQQNTFGPSSTGNSGDNAAKIGSPGYQTFGIVGDGGILLGGTPGTKFFVGFHYWIDFPPEIVVGPDSNFPAHAKPGRGVIVVDSVQFYVGPSIGLQFGH